MISFGDRAHPINYDDCWELHQKNWRPEPTNCEVAIIEINDTFSSSLSTTKKNDVGCIFFMDDEVINALPFCHSLHPLSAFLMEFKKWKNDNRFFRIIEQCISFHTITMTWGNEEHCNDMHWIVYRKWSIKVWDRSNEQKRKWWEMNTCMKDEGE